MYKISSRSIGVTLIVISIILFFIHRKNNDNQDIGEYKFNNQYKNVSLTKHDLGKAFVVELVLILIYGLGNQKFFDSKDILNSWVGRTGVIIIGFLVYHELFQPYIVNKIPKF